ncbi:MAG TPA: hypothetical protein VJL82_01805, partial [Rhizomicrobium sp.]|nr:hypothetical protein [Rhizomicrobium sp.]
SPSRHQAGAIGLGQFSLVCGHSMINLREPAAYGHRILHLVVATVPAEDGTKAPPAGRNAGTAIVEHSAKAECS